MFFNFFINHCRSSSRLRINEYIFFKLRNIVKLKINMEINVQIVYIFILNAKIYFLLILRFCEKKKNFKFKKCLNKKVSCL